MSMLLDTNTVSELIRKLPDPAVETRAASHPLEDLFFSMVGEAELRYGSTILPVGQRRETLVSDIETVLRDAFDNRVLQVGSEVARAFAGRRGHAPFRRTPRRTGGVPDRGNRPLSQHGGGDTQRSGLRGRRSLGGGMSGASDAFARAGMDARLQRRSVSPGRFAGCEDRPGRGRG